MTIKATSRYKLSMQFIMYTNIYFFDRSTTCIFYPCVTYFTVHTNPVIHFFIPLAVAISKWISLIAWSFANASLETSRRMSPFALEVVVDHRNRQANGLFFFCSFVLCVKLIQVHVSMNVTIHTFDFIPNNNYIAYICYWCLCVHARNIANNWLTIVQIF
jgi:hypothetical protein